MLNLLGVTILKSFSPYFRKDILGSIAPHDFLLLYTLGITFFVFLYFGYRMYCENYSTFIKTYQNCRKLSYKQVGLLTIMSLLSVAGSVVLYDSDKAASPLLNNMISRVASILSVVLIGIWLYGENMNTIQIGGILTTVLGILMIFWK